MELNDPEGSWQAFLLLEGFPDGMGGWNFLQVFGSPVMDLDDALVSDLLVWRNAKERAERDKPKDDEDAE